MKASIQLPLVVHELADAAFHWASDENETLAEARKRRLRPGRRPSRWHKARCRVRYRRAGLGPERRVQVIAGCEASGWLNWSKAVAVNCCVAPPVRLARRAKCSCSNKFDPP